MGTTAPTLAELHSLLSSEFIPVGSEREMQMAIAKLLVENGIQFRPEARLSSRDRIDFLVGRVGIEVKHAGSYQQVASQLLRYAESDSVDAVLLVTDRAAHRKLSGMENEQNKPMQVCFTGFHGF